MDAGMYVRSMKSKNMQEEKNMADEKTLSKEEIDEMYSSIYKLISDLLSATEENTVVQKKILSKIDQLLETEEQSNQILKSLGNRL